MLIKANSILESLFILLIISLFSSIFIINKPKVQYKKEIISSIINTQFKSYLNHEKLQFEHNLVNESISFNMNGNINMANTIYINGSNQSFTIMLFTGRIHE